MTRTSRKLDEFHMACAQWNAMFPVGSPVRFHHVIGEPEYTTHTTRSHAYVCDAGYGVLFLNGYSGYVALEAVEPEPEVA